MAVASSLLPPPDMPIFNRCYHCGQYKGSMNKIPVFSFPLHLSSHSLRQDALSFYLLSNLHQPLGPTCAKFNGLVCRSLLNPSGGNEIPMMKAAATLISRAWSNLQGNPVVMQLVPAVGIVAFSACGLVPLMYFGRSIFLNVLFPSSTHSILHCEVVL
ncbi:OLC1v1017225C1 [Oldenlandia corymbosa var. corymbosa]|uniref:OLC1v1017225C1 n=1 Tax=Oldenlandia corymbosa var. corymbosa TaxID=529605 RepID=A0AAV1E8Y1_OLDCO|nr:OLC1v1017225C1 [Oldenlandia corymbosa var. corymbosa]